MEVRRDALKLMIEEGKQPERKEEFESDIEGLERQIKLKQAIIEKGRIKLGGLALEKEIKSRKYE